MVSSGPAAAGAMLMRAVEPGYYEDGAFGIRTENLVMVVKADTPHSFGGKPYLKFEVSRGSPTILFMWADVF
jgi:Xaa-Pro aminopeptidase